MMTILTKTRTLLQTLLFCGFLAIAFIASLYVLALAIFLVVS